MKSTDFQLGQLVSLYEGMTKRGVSQPDRLQQARELCANPAALAKKFDDDVAAFASYENRATPFHSGATDRDRKKFAPSSKTRVVAQSLITLIGGGTVEVNDRPELSFRYIDREIVTARAPGATFRTFDGETRSAKKLPRLDLLLANADDRTPIIGELKVAEDRDPFYALIQALAHATMLVTPNQLERLRDQYRDAFAEHSEKVDVYVVLAGAAEGSNWQAFERYARDLSEGLMQNESFTRWVRQVQQVELNLEARSAT